MYVSQARRGATTRREVLAVLLALLLAVPAIAPLTYPGFFEAHSGFLPAFNAAHPEAAPGWGRAAAPVRGEGALPYLLIRPFYAFTGSGIAAVEWGYALAFLLGAACVYAWSRRWVGLRGAVLAATVYTYLPWHLATVYVRGAYAEVWLWAFWPLMLHAVDRLRRWRPRDVAIAVAAGLPALAASFWTQPGLAGLFMLVLVPYSILTVFERRGIVPRSLLALTLLFVVLWRLVALAGPAPIAFAEHYLYPFQLLSPHWDTGISVQGALDGLPFQLGIAAAGLSLVTVALWLSDGRARATTAGMPAGASAAQASAVPGPASEPALAIRTAPAESSSTHPGSAAHTAPGTLRVALTFWCAVVVAIVLLVLPLAGWLWRISGLDALLTYPWQLLALAGLPLAFLPGAALRLDDRLAEVPAWTGLVTLVVLASYFYLAPSFIPTGSGPGQVDAGPEPVALFQPVGAAEPQIMLLDYDMEPPTLLTPTLTLTLTWQAMAPVDGDYTIFVHALDAGEKVAQQDTRPCNAQCPTDTWQPGDIVIDRHQVALPADAVGEIDRVAVGLYLLETGDRAAVYGQDDRTVYLNVR